MKVKRTTYVGARKKVEYVDVPDSKSTVKPKADAPKNKSDKKADA